MKRPAMSIRAVVKEIGRTCSRPVLRITPLSAHSIKTRTITRCAVTGDAFARLRTAPVQPATASTIRSMISEELLEILVCPKCHTKVELSEDGQSLKCPSCRLRYRIDDGIPVMLIDEAEPY
jgi:uncharacterized protein YbaR (Trm112 family)